MVISAVGEEETMMIGFVDFALRAPREGSDRSKGEVSPQHQPPDDNNAPRLDVPGDVVARGGAARLPEVSIDFRSARIFSIMTLCRKGWKFYTGFSESRAATEPQSLLGSMRRNSR